MTPQNFSQTAAFIWSVADLLRGDFKQSQYGRIILPFTLLRRLECVLEDTKQAVIDQAPAILATGFAEEMQEKQLLRISEHAFYNTSPMTLSKMGQGDIKDNLSTYIQSFSKDARDIFEHFKFEEFIGQLDDANLLYKVVQKFANTDLSPKAISNHDMGLVFEELIRRFAESSNETAGEHFTPRDIIRLTTSLVFMEDDAALTKDSIIRTIYDPTAGTGGFLSAGMEYVHELNPHATIRTFGQELNPESYAICKADMLIKGQEVSRIKLGNTLSNDQLASERFDYMLSNPPFGVDWKKISETIIAEHHQKGFEGRFGAGLPRVSDGSLLFLMHLISKMQPLVSTKPVANDAQDNEHQGSRIGIILNGSPLFTGGAGSGESEIRRYILEADLLEAIIALPTDMFYNTGIATYIWILSNKKAADRRGKIQLIDGSNLFSKMRKSLGSKRHEMSEDDIRTITKSFGDFEVVDARKLDKPSTTKSTRGRQSATPKTDTAKTFASKIFAPHEFGYRRLTIERPLRLSACLSDDAIARLRFAPKPFDTVMPALFEKFFEEWAWADVSCDTNLETHYGYFGKQDCDIHTEARAMIKSDFPELKESQIKTVLDQKLWQSQLTLMTKAETLQAAIGSGVFDDFNAFEKVFKTALKDTGITLDAKAKKQLMDAITYKNPSAEPVIKKTLKTADPIYGAFAYQSPTGSNKIAEFVADGDLRDFENVPLDPSLTTAALIEGYFAREVLPHVPDAWINADKRDAIDGDIGVVGYEIPFNRHFYQYEPPRALADIDADLDKVSAEIMQLLGEVHS